MSFERNKTAKKAARLLLEKGWQKRNDSPPASTAGRSFHLGEERQKAKETYHQVYRAITDFDRHIAQRYDGMAGSCYLPVIVEQ